MTQPSPTETEPTEPAPTQITLLELDRAITDASREYIAAQRARPRDQQRIGDAKDELDGLITLRDQLYPDA